MSLIALARSMPVNFPPLADPYDGDGRAGILDRVQDAIVALADAVFVFAGEFFRTRWTRIVGETLDLRHDATSVSPGQLLQLSGR